MNYFGLAGWIAAGTVYGFWAGYLYREYKYSFSSLPTRITQCVLWPIMGCLLVLVFVIRGIYDNIEYGVRWIKYHKQWELQEKRWREEDSKDKLKAD